MINNYYQKHKEGVQKEGRERYQNLSEEEKTKGKKMRKKNIKILLKKKKKKSMISIYLRSKTKS